MMKPEQQMPPAPILAVEAPKEIIREQDKIMLVLAYLGILSLVPLLTVKDSDYVKWHAKNGLVLALAGMVGFPILAMIPVIHYVLCLAGPALFVIDIMAMVKALNGVRWRIPGISDLADKF